MNWGGSLHLELKRNVLSHEKRELRRTASNCPEETNVRVSAADNDWISKSTILRDG